MSKLHGDESDDAEDIGVNPSSNARLGEVIGQRLSRRETLQDMATSAAFGLFGSPLAAPPTRPTSM